MHVMQSVSVHVHVAVRLPSPVTFLKARLRSLATDTRVRTNRTRRTDSRANRPAITFTATRHTGGGSRGQRAGEGETMTDPIAATDSMPKHAEGEPSLGTDEVFLRSRPIMRLEDVTVSFAGRAAVRGVTFDIHEKEVTALIGPSGSG